jgi:virginiamycin B lyase
MPAARHILVARKKDVSVREEIMFFRSFIIAISLAFAALASSGAIAQAPVAALAGLVSSAAGGAMEGVLVSASKTGSSVTVTVVTDKDGRFSFPAIRLAPGQYSLGSASCRL